jgi:hypothetical protein
MRFGGTNGEPLLSGYDSQESSGVGSEGIINYEGGVTESLPVLPSGQAELESYNKWDWLLSSLGLASESGFALFTLFATNNFQKAILIKLNANSAVSELFYILAVSSSVSDSLGSWLMMANMPEERTAFWQNLKNGWQSFRERGPIYRSGSVACLLAVFLSFTFGSLGSFFFIGQMIIYIFSNVASLFSTPDLLYKFYYNDQENKSEVYKHLKSLKGLAFLFLTATNMVNRSWTFYGGQEDFRALIKSFWNTDIGSLPSYVSATCTGIQTVASQSRKNYLLLFDEKKSTPTDRLKISNTLLVVPFYSFRYSFLFLIWWSRAFSGPQRVIALHGEIKEPADYTTTDFIKGSLGLFLLSGPSALQYLYWFYTNVDSGTYYIGSKIGLVSLIEKLDQWLNRCFPSCQRSSIYEEKKETVPPATKWNPSVSGTLNGVAISCYDRLVSAANCFSSLFRSSCCSRSKINETTESYQP